MTFRHYTLRVKHDAGFVSIRTVAQSEDAAIALVMRAERCPRRSIRRVYIGRTVGA